MLKRRLVFFLFVMMLPVIAIKSRELPLSFFVFSGVLVIPIYYLYAERDKKLFTSALVLFALMDLFYLITSFSFSMLLLTAIHTLFIILLVYYRKFRNQDLNNEAKKNQEILKDWEQLQHKHQSRLDNLQHLEKQAASLMDLFEMARDFSECLSMELLTEQIYKKVLPEMPFSSFMILLDEDVSFESESQAYSITEKGATQEMIQFSSDEVKAMELAKKEMRLQSDESRWIFPLYIKKDFLAYMLVEGAEQGDLAKFEVLAAHLVLQIKKIKLYGTVRDLSIVDGLTQVFVRRHFSELFEEELKRSIKHGFSMALLMLDIDHFKRYNDEFGHLVGDATLKEVAGILRDSLRKVDIVARYGGEEFIVVIPETEMRGALEIAERVRSGIARHSFKVYDVTTRVTASLGIAIFPKDCDYDEDRGYYPELTQELINRADEALYRAKEEGRNRVICYQDIS